MASPPLAKIMFKNAKTGVTAECGVVWEGKFGTGNFQFQTKREVREVGDKKYEKIPFSDAMELATTKDEAGKVGGWINLVPTARGGKITVVVEDQDEDEF